MGPDQKNTVNDLVVTGAWGNFKHNKIKMETPEQFIIEIK